MKMQDPIALDAALCSGLVEQAQQRSASVRGPPQAMLPAAELMRLHLRPDRYDPQRWFELFPHLRMQADWVLDFVYAWWGNGGAPHLYARRVSSGRLSVIEQVRAAFPRGNEWQVHLEFDNEPVARFEAVVLARVAPRFHRVWHAHADNAEFLCSTEALCRAVGPAMPESTTGRMPPGMGPPTPTEHHALLQLDPRPFVTLDHEVATVSLLSIVHPGGLSRQRYLVRRNQPVALSGETLLWRRSGGPVH